MSKKGGYCLSLVKDAFSTKEDYSAGERVWMGVIGLVGGELLKRNLGTADKIDVENDILKIACIERHKGTNHIGVGYG